jgi:hypothetical protein
MVTSSFVIRYGSHWQKTLRVEPSGRELVELREKRFATAKSVG